jgi:hypothetical protein
MNGNGALEAVVIKDITPLVVSRSLFFDNNGDATARLFRP